MLTFEEIIEIMGGNPNEVIECDDGFVMGWGNVDFDEDQAD